MVSKEQKGDCAHRVKKIMLITGYNSRISEIFTKNLVKILLKENDVILSAHVEDISKYGPLSGHYDLPYVKPNKGPLQK